MSRGTRARLGYEPLAFLRSYAVAAVDPGLAAAHGSGLRRAEGARARRASPGATWGCVEIHEAFAAQVLSNVQAWGSSLWAERLGLPGAGRRRGLGSHQRHGGFHRDRPSVRCHRRPHRHHARQRDAPARRAIRADLHLRTGRHGQRPGAGEDVSMSAFKVDIQSGIAVVTLDVPGAPVNTLSTAVAQEFDGLLTRLESDPLVRADRAHLGKARQLHRRCRHRGVHPAAHRGGSHRPESAGAGADEPRGGVPEAGRRGDPRKLPRWRARAGARLPLARGHRSSEDPARTCPKCSSASSPAPVGATACRG